VKKKTDVAETSYLMLGDLYIPVHLLISHIDSRRGSGRAMRLVHTMIRWYGPPSILFALCSSSPRLSLYGFSSVLILIERKLMLDRQTDRTR